MFSRFGLVLNVTHACNLRCTYCYTGDKFCRSMAEPMGKKAIDRAVASLARGGTLELGFFGGEPLLEASLVARLIHYARRRVSANGTNLSLSLTTNGTLTDSKAWGVIADPELQLAISCDGTSEIHDRHRPARTGAGTAELVHATIRRLVNAGRRFSVTMVVRPDTVDSLPGGIVFLQSLGVDRIEPSLDLWASWDDSHIRKLEGAVAHCARIWRDSLPERCIGWFDEKAAELAEIPAQPTARCGFGYGEMAVAPSGRLYPCERLIGNDSIDNPMALCGNVMEGDNFLDFSAAMERSDEACHSCAMRSNCNTICRCSNYVRTGNVSKPDRLLCAWNQACLTQTALVLNEMAPSIASPFISLSTEDLCTSQGES